MPRHYGRGNVYHFFLVALGLPSLNVMLGSPCRFAWLTAFSRPAAVLGKVRVLGVLLLLVAITTS